MITIKNIDKLVGHFINYDYGCSRKIDKVHKTKNTLGEDQYVFTFIKRGDCKRFNQRTEVRLLRKKERKGYELFVMGLHGTTVKNISLEDISNYTRFVTKIAEVLKTASDWWDGNSN